MNKSILIGLLAAAMVPSAAIANPHHGHQRAMAVRHHAAVRREVRHDRQVVRRAVRHERQLARRHHRGYVAYAAPYRSWNYRTLNVGYRLRPAYYQPRYVITDYGMFRLRAPMRHTQWIRYGDDLLLVNVRTGRVLEVLHNRFW